MCVNSLNTQQGVWHRVSDLVKCCMTRQTVLHVRKHVGHSVLGGCGDFLPSIHPNSDRAGAGLVSEEKESLGLSPRGCTLLGLPSAIGGWTQVLWSLLGENRETYKPDSKHMSRAG